MPTGIWKNRKRRPLSESHRKNISRAISGDRNPMNSPGARETHRKAVLESWKDPKKRENRIEAIKEAMWRPDVRARHLKGTRSLERNLKNSEARMGNKNPAWRGGVSFESYGQEFNDELKFYIRNRDDFVCQFCGKDERENGRKHDIHHMNHNKKNNKERNLLTLCCSCNSKADHSREKWELCFTVLQEIRHLTYPIGGI